MKPHLIFIKLAFILAACFCLTMPVAAQTNDNSPEAVVQNYWAAMQAGEWAKSASLVHPQSLSEIRKSSDRLVTSLTTFGEANLASHYGVTSRAEYDQLSDAVVFERLLTRMSGVPGYQEILRATKYKLLGTVKESDNVAHVVYRSDVELLDAQGQRLKLAKFEQRNQVIGFSVEVKLKDPDDREASVISVAKDGDAWRIVAVDDVEKMLNDWEKSLEEFKGQMQKFAEAMVDQQKARSSTKRKPRRN